MGHYRRMWNVCTQGAFTLSHAHTFTHLSLPKQACHLSLLLALYFSPAPSPLATDGETDGSGKNKRR